MMLSVAADYMALTIIMLLEFIPLCTNIQQYLFVYAV